jgi:hypothetical protein
MQPTGVREVNVKMLLQSLEFGVHGNQQDKENNVNMLLQSLDFGVCDPVKFASDVVKEQ